MTEPKYPPLRSLPVRPSLESLRRQAKQLARAVAAGDTQAVARARAQLARWAPPLSARDAQLVLAREYGFPGWQALREEVLTRAGKGLDWAAQQAGRAIHDNDAEGLRRLLGEFPALLSWRGDEGETLLSAATTSFGDSGEPAREQQFTRPVIAELLIDAGAVVAPDLWGNVVRTRASGMLHLLDRKGVLPRNLTTLAALGDMAGLEDAAAGAGLEALHDAFMAACRFRHAAAAGFLLERCIALDPGLGQRIEGWRGRAAFIENLADHPQNFGDPWQTMVVNEVMRTIEDRDLPAFTGLLKAEPWLLGEAAMELQVELIERATLNNRRSFIQALLALNPALLRRPPPSDAITFAVEYGHAHLTQDLAPLWPVPDDLPHAAALGDLLRVARWFDADGRPALGELSRHYPANNPATRANLRWGEPTAQQVLDVALAWACMNKQLDVAAFLVAHGADVNTDWGTHEPASILHECALHGNYEAAGFLIDHGIDLAMRDYRWNATAAGWAYNAARDEKMTAFLQAAEKR